MLLALGLGGATAARPAPAMASPDRGVTPGFHASDPPDTMLNAAKLRAAYGITDTVATTRGDGQRIYIIDSINDETVASVQEYRSQTGFWPGTTPAPTCTEDNGCLQLLDSDGREVASPPPPDSDDNDEHGTVVAEVAMAVCPRCDITLVEDRPDLVEALVSVRKVGARYVNLSTADELTSDDANQVLAKEERSFLEASGVFYAAAAGNSGYSTHPAFPTWTNRVISVGGVARREGGYFLGLDWSSSSCRADTAKPPWQAAADTVPGSACDGRALADVSGVATDVAAVYPAGTLRTMSWHDEKGTSLAAPAITAIAALNDSITPDRKLGRIRVPGSVPPKDLYQHADGAVTDVQEGPSNDTDNTGCPDRLCRPQAGWDGPTGLGVPHGIGALAPSLTPGRRNFDRIASSAGRCLGTPRTAPVEPGVLTFFGDCASASFDSQWDRIPSRNGRGAVFNRFRLHGTGLCLVSHGDEEPVLDSCGSKQNPERGDLWELPAGGGIRSDYGILSISYLAEADYGSHQALVRPKVDSGIAMRQEYATA